jgi:hypothetical protein
VPFRLLGVVPDLENLEEIGGRTFRGYAADGVAVTIACASGADPGAIRSHAALLGIQALILLDYRPAERDSPSLTALLEDILRAVRPHVVVLGGDPVMIKTGRSAFEAVRAGAVSAAGNLPAKLYLPAAPDSAETSTVIRAGAGSSETRASFRRLFPSPWVTGVVERDLFAGLTPDPDELSTSAGLRLAG